MITVNKELCIGCGSCESICPQSFKLEDDGKSSAISQEMFPCTQDAANACPVQAITVS